MGKAEDVAGCGEGRPEGEERGRIITKVRGSWKGCWGLETSTYAGTNSTYSTYRTDSAYSTEREGQCPLIGTTNVEFTSFMIFIL